MCVQRHKSRVSPRRPQARSVLVVVFLWVLGCSLALAGDAESATCADCHETDALLAKSVHGGAGLECASCHTSLAEVKEFPHEKPARVDCRGCHEVKTSKAHPPTCADCHGSHEIEAGSRGNRSRLSAHFSQACAKCHEAVVTEYFEGIHGQELRKGNADVPTCFTCHGGHGIMRKDDPDSPVNLRARAETCSRCHDNAEIAAKYGMPPGRLQSFVGSFHGLANVYGDRKVANCASCHGVHRILPSSNPLSTINSNNIPRTCGGEGCHPNAGHNFAVGKIHLMDRWEDNPLTFLARRFYQGMIVSMMVVFGVYMAVDLRYRFKIRGAHRARSGDLE